MKHIPMRVTQRGDEITVGITGSLPFADWPKDAQDRLIADLGFQVDEEPAEAEQALFEVRRDAGLEMSRLQRLAMRRQCAKLKLAVLLRQAQHMARFLILWGCAAPVAALLVGLIAGGFFFGRP